MKEQLFVYGTLKNPEVQKEIIGRVVEGNFDILERYKKSAIKINGETYPIIVPNFKSYIKGLIISVSSEEIELIDKYETNAYKRKKIILKSGKSAWVYKK